MAGLGGFTALLALGAASLAVLPSAGLAVGAVHPDSPGLSFGERFGTFTPASVNPELAALVASRAEGQGKRLRFTPAGIANRSSQPVTVAVRVDSDAARAISVRSAIAARTEQASPAPVAINPTRYDLGIARGYQSFAQPRRSPVLPEGLARSEMPDLASFAPSQPEQSRPSRFSARIQRDESTPVGNAPRAVEEQARQSFDLSSSFRVTRNLDLTAGLRYQQERDRLAPLTNGEQDSQAVYVGTQFRF